MSMVSWISGQRNKQDSESPAQKTNAPARRAHVIVLGNEKGGSGKTTTGMHLIVALMRMGFKVGTIDIDARQRSLSRYIENRRKTMEKQGIKLPCPHHIIITKSPFNIREEAEEDEMERFNQALTRLEACDFIIIDSPGNDTYLSRISHSYADTVITPINDSFVDLDVLASVDGQTLKIVRPSIYSEMVWEQKLARAKRDGGSVEWVVMRNRLSNLDARNKRLMKKVTEELSRRIGFRLAPGFSERVIYREMFLQGLTVLDVMDTSDNKSITLSHIAARQEVRDLLKMLRIPEVDRRINEMRQKEAEELVSHVSNEKPDANDAPSDTSAPEEKASTEASLDQTKTEPEPASSPSTPSNMLTPILH